MSILQWLLDQLQRGYAYLISLIPEVVANIIAGVIVALLGVLWTWLMVRVFRRKRKRTKDETLNEAVLHRQRKAMLDAVEGQWIRGPLQRLLHDQAPIFLGLTETPEAIDRPSEYSIQTPGQALPRTRDTSAILDVFDASGSLLILGAPGSGKTVTLLDLARQLIDRAREDEDALLPVVFILASWAQEKKPLDEWMVAQMDQSPYCVSPGLGRHWIERHDVLPLLDGLDEVEESARAACVEAINTYRSKEVGGAAVVVCSREAEYVQLSTRLKVEGAVTLQPLTGSQIDQYLSRFGIQSAMLTRMLAEDEQLRELARTPLWLDVMAVAYGGDDGTTAPKAVATGDIFNAYIRRVLLEHRQPLQEWSPEDCMRWLRWLARQLERTKQVLFRLEDMQPYWLGGKVEQSRYRRWIRWGMGGIVVLGFGLFGRILDLAWGGRFGGLFSMLSGATVGGLLFALCSRLFVGLGDGSTGPFIEATPDLAWDRHESAIGLILGLTVGLFNGLFAGLAVWRTGRLIFGLVFGVLNWLMAGLLSWLAFGFRPVSSSVRKIEWEMRPNQGTWRSVRYGLKGGLVIGLYVGPVYGLYVGLVSGTRAGLIYGLGLWLYSWLVGATTLWGKPAVLHGILRWQLWQEGLTPEPWRYVAFLDAMNGRLLLDRIGGVYRFKHDLLLKHVAQLDDTFIDSLSSKP